MKSFDELKIENMQRDEDELERKYQEQFKLEEMRRQKMKAYAESLQNKWRENEEEKEK